MLDQSSSRWRIWVTSNHTQLSPFPKCNLALLSSFTNSSTIFSSAYQLLLLQLSWWRTTKEEDLELLLDQGWGNFKRTLIWRWTHLWTSSGGNFSLMLTGRVLLFVSSLKPWFPFHSLWLIYLNYSFELWHYSSTSLSWSIFSFFSKKIPNLTMLKFYPYGVFIIWY